MLSRSPLPIATAAMFLAIASAQEFDVASVRVNNSGSGNSGAETHNGRLKGTNLSLKTYIRMAYQLNDFQVAGPAWINSDRYDIQAKGPDGEGHNSFAPMLQTLLADRFRLRVHREIRMDEAYELTVANSGAKMKENSEAGDESTNDTSNSRHGRLALRASSMGRFAEVLSRHSERPVVDRTGLAGRYDFTLDWTIDETRASDSEPSAPSLFTAIDEQLGLKLQARRVEMEILVVDSALRVPTEN